MQSTIRSFFQPLARTEPEKEAAEKDHLEENLTPKSEPATSDQLVNTATLCPHSLAKKAGKKGEGDAQARDNKQVSDSVPDQKVPETSPSTSSTTSNSPSPTSIPRRKTDFTSLKMASAPPTKRKRKLNEEGRVFQEKWELRYFCATVNGKIHCLICNSSLATPKEYNLKRHYETNHQSYDKYEGPMRVSRLKELKAKLRQQQTCFTKIEKGNVASVTASHELSRMIAMSGKSYSEGDFVKQCFVKMAQVVYLEKAHLFEKISLTRDTVAEQIEHE